MKKCYKLNKKKIVCPECGGKGGIFTKKMDRREKKIMCSTLYWDPDVCNYYGYASCKCGMCVDCECGETRQDVIDKITRVLDTMGEDEYEYEDEWEDEWEDAQPALNEDQYEDCHVPALIYPDYHDPMWAELFIYSSLLACKVLHEDIDNWPMAEEYIKRIEETPVRRWMEEMNSVEDMIRVTHTEGYLGIGLPEEATWEDYDIWADYSDNSEGFGGMENFCRNVWRSIGIDEIAVEPLES